MDDVFSGVQFSMFYILRISRVSYSLWQIHSELIGFLLRRFSEWLESVWQSRYERMLQEVSADLLDRALRMSLSQEIANLDPNVLYVAQTDG